jgi:hypothetical protein
MWFILYNEDKRGYSLVDKEHLRFYKNDILIQELDGNLSEDEARKFYLEFLEMLYSPNNK